MDMILDRAAEPGMEDIKNYITGDAGIMWRALTGYIEETYSAKPQMAYSVCAGKPGWNVKYKKGGKALCTLYPESNSFMALVVLSALDMELFDAVKKDYTPYVSKLFDDCKTFNNTKWLMVRISDDSILDDVKKLLRLKLSKK